MFRTINCSQIDFDDTTFLMSYPVESEKIIQSVGTIGVLQPIIVSGCACEKYQIIAGFRRVYACRQIRIELVNAYLYPIDPANALSAFLLALHENVSHRIFNAVEKSLILTKFVNQFQCDRDEVIRYYLPLLELAPNSKVLAIYLKIADFEEEIKQYIADHDLPMAILEMLANLAAEDRRAAFTLISTLKLGVNKLKELITELDEIALRDNRPIHQLLADQSLQDILQHPNYPVPQKAEQIRQLIRTKRYPQLTTLEETYRAHLKHLHLAPEIHIQTDPAFEDDALAVSFRVQTPEHLQAVAADLLQLAQKPELQALLALLSGKDLSH